MIRQLTLIRNVGRFDSVTVANTPLERLTIIYAENGRGKTTLAAILRSLATGNSVPITERRRLATQNPPHVVIDCAGDQNPAMFQNGQWNRCLPNVVVFDDLFVDQNLYSGLAVGGEHRQKLHELILGERGVNLNRQLQDLVARIEEHNRELTLRKGRIQQAQLGGLTIDQFCDLNENPEVEEEIKSTERKLAATRDQDQVSKTPAFDLLNLPAFDLLAIERILQSGVPELDAEAVERIHKHFETAGEGAEKWISEGVLRQNKHPQGLIAKCVFCAQDITNSPLMRDYRAFFSDAYRQLQDDIANIKAVLNQTHADTAGTNLERAVRVFGERKQFWSQFIEMPELQLDTVPILDAWEKARSQLADLLIQKQASPLDSITVPETVREAVQLHDKNISQITKFNEQLTRLNELITAVKKQAAQANPQAINASLSHLKTVQVRYLAETVKLCDEYTAEKEAKAVTEQLRDQARNALAQYRNQVFPKYQDSINKYLEQFNAGFSLDSVVAANIRGGSTCTYNIVINNTAIAVDGGNRQPGEHSFRNTLSAGDRNALALAFFFASIEQDPSFASKTVIIDDPVSSLDEHRSLTTVQEIRALSRTVAQVIVLSHSKPFLCRVWEHANKDARIALHVIRDGDGSTIQTWNVQSDCITEHDRRCEKLNQFRNTGNGDERVIAGFLRPHIESFCRVAYPKQFPPGKLLGPFIIECGQWVNLPEQILSRGDIAELTNIKEYANRFHHDTNPAWETEAINNGELTGFVNRVLTFCRRP